MMATMRSKKRSTYEDTGMGIEYDNTSPRSGKWTAEEENFASRLIRDFETGNLLDCEDGCTLRSYLARKLNCAPMRISKKFAGKCIGKHTFTRKVGSIPSDSQSLDSCDNLSRRKMRRFNDPSSCFRSDSPYNNSQLSDGDSEDSPTSSDISSEKGREWDLKISHNRPFGKSIPFSLSFTSFDQFASIGADSTNNSNAISDDDSSVEAAEWKDVLTYFCGSLMSEEMDTSKGMKLDNKTKISFHTAMF